MIKKEENITLPQSLKILIVDDSKTDREIYKNFLKRDPDHQYSFFESETLEEALSFLEADHFDVILLDYNLPDGDGLEFLQDHAQLIEQTLTPVIMLTGLGDQEVAVAAMKSGAKDYLIKDKITESALQRSIQNAIVQSELEKTVELQKLELQRSNQELETFASIIAHDLKTPLFKVQMISDTLLTFYHENLDEKGKNFLNKMKSSLLRMQKLIDALFEYSIVTRKEKEFKVIHLNQVIKDVLSDLETEIQDKKAKIEVENLFQVEGNEPLLRQLFQNLISNALKYSTPGIIPQITISAIKKKNPNQALFPSQKEVCEIHVSDNGIGFEEKELPLMLTPFQRLETAHNIEGLGIGLATCLKIVQYHNGSITAKSKPGDGATFIIQLPCSQKSNISLSASA